MLGFGSIGEFALGEFAELSDGTVVLNPAVIVFTAALTAASGALAPVLNQDVSYSDASVAELAIGESLPPSSRPSGVITFAADLDVATRSKKPTFQIIES